MVPAVRRTGGLADTVFIVFLSNFSTTAFVVARYGTVPVVRRTGGLADTAKCVQGFSK